MVNNKANILILACLFIVTSLIGGKENYISLQKALETPKKAKYIEVSCDSLNLVSLQEHVSELEHIAGVAFVGKPKDEGQIWDVLSHLRMLEQVIFIDNDLSKIGTGGSSSTLKKLWIKGSPNFDVNSLNSTLSKANYIQYLRIDSVNGTTLPYSIANLELLKELQITNSHWKPRVVMSVAGHCKKLKKLVVSDNSFQFLSGELKRIQHVKYLDLSGNAISKLPKSIIKLSRLDTLVLNRNSFSSMEELGTRLKSMRLQHIIIDGDTTVSREDFEYRLPGATIEWRKEKLSHNYFELPRNNEVAVKIEHSVDSIGVEALSFKNLSGGSMKILSPAYVVYDNIEIPTPLKPYDTIQFKSRFKSRDYEVCKKIEVQNHTQEGKYHPVKFNSKTGKWDKKKKLKKINHSKQSPIKVEVVKAPKEFKTTLLFSIKTKETSVLKAYSRLVWEPVNFSAGNDKFSERFIKQKSWSDVRLFVEEGDEGVHKLVFKGRFGDDSLYVKARTINKLGDEKHEKKFNEKGVQKTYKKYEKNLAKIEKRFNKDLARLMKKVQRKDIKRINYLWGLVEARMTEEEKNMTRPDWIRYCEKVLENEPPLLAKEKLELIYLTRYLTSQGFKEAKGNDFFVGQQWKTVKLLNSDSVEVQLKDFCVIDMDRRLVKYYEADSVSKLLVESFHNYQFVAELKNGKIVVLNNHQTAKLLLNGGYVIDPKHYVNGSGTNASFFMNNILPEINKLVY